MTIPYLPPHLSLLLLLLSSMPSTKGQALTFAGEGGTTTTPTTSASSTFTPLATPSLLFAPVEPATLTACQTAAISWQLYNEPPMDYDITLQVMNFGIDQTIPSATTTSSTTPSIAVSYPTSTSTSSSLVLNVPERRKASSPSINGLAKRTSLTINGTLVSQSANYGYVWYPIGVPEGRYYLQGEINDSYGTYAVSSVFTVLNGTDLSCLANSSLVQAALGSASASSTPASSTATSSTTFSTSSPQSTSTSASAGLSNGVGSGSGSGSGGIGTGAIVGIVVGVVGGLAILGLLIFCCIRKRKSSDNGDSTREMEQHGDHFLWAGERVGSGPNTATSHHGSGSGSGSGGESISRDYVLPPLHGISDHHHTGSSFDSFDGTGENSHHSGESYNTVPETHGGGDPFVTPLHEDGPIEGGYGTAVPVDIFHERNPRRASSPVTQLGGGSHAPNTVIGSTNEITRSRSIEDTSPTSPAKQTTRSRDSPPNGLSRTNSQSARRKPVPVLGAELRGEMAKADRKTEKRQSGSQMEGKEKKTFALVPDMPLRQD